MFLVVVRVVKELGTRQFSSRVKEPSLSYKRQLSLDNIIHGVSSGIFLLTTYLLLHISIQNYFLILVRGTLCKTLSHPWSTLMQSKIHTHTQTHTARKSTFPFMQLTLLVSIIIRHFTASVLKANVLRLRKDTPS